MKAEQARGLSKISPIVDLLASCSPSSSFVAWLFDMSRDVRGRHSMCLKSWSWGAQEVFVTWCCHTKRHSLLQRLIISLAWSGIALIRAMTTLHPPCYLVIKLSIIRSDLILTRDLRLVYVYEPGKTCPLTDDLRLHSFAQKIREYRSYNSAATHLMSTTDIWFHNLDSMAREERYKWRASMKTLAPLNFLASFHDVIDTDTTWRIVFIASVNFHLFPSPSNRSNSWWWPLQTPGTPGMMYEPNLPIIIVKT